MNEISTLTQNIEDLKYDRTLAIQDKNYEEAIRLTNLINNLELLLNGRRVGTSLNTGTISLNTEPNSLNTEPISLNSGLNQDKRKKKPPTKPSETKRSTETKNINSKTLKKKPTMKPSELKNMVHKRETIKKLLDDKKNWNSYNKSRKELQKTYNKEKQKIERDNIRLSAKSMFKPTIIHHTNLFDNQLATIAKPSSKGMITQAKLAPYYSEYKKVKRMEEDLKYFKKIQSDIIKNMHKKDERYKEVFKGEIYNMQKEITKNIQIFDGYDKYYSIKYRVEQGLPITEDSKSKLNKFYGIISTSINEYVRAFIQHMTHSLEYDIIELLWGFCLPNNPITDSEYVLSAYNIIDPNLSYLKQQIEEYTPIFQDDPDFEPYSLEKINELYDLLKSIVKIKLNGKAKWDGKYLTEDELYKYFIPKTPSIILIDELEAYLTPILYKFPYNKLSQVESEILKYVLLLKIKENQPRTIRIDENMVMPNYLVRASPIPGTGF